MHVMHRGAEEPRASVLFVCCNQRQYVRQSYLSLLQQQGPPLEIIASDDCSRDETASIVAEEAASYRGPHTLVLNRNTGRLGLDHVTLLAERAHCDFQIQAHGDDIALPHRCQTLFEAANQTGASVVGSAIQRMDARGVDIPVEPEVLLTDFSAASLITQDRYMGMIGAVLAWNREVITRFPRLEESYLSFGHGRLLCFRGALLGGTHCVAEPLLRYRRSPGQWSREMHPRLPQAGQEDIRLSRSLAIATAMRQDLQHLLRHCPERVPEAASLLATLEAHTLQLAGNWARERHRLHATGFRPEWIPLEAYLHRYQGLQARARHPVLVEALYWAERLVRTAKKALPRH